MTERTPVSALNLDGYGAEIMEWSEVRDKLAVRHEMEVAVFLTTVSEDCVPHTNGIGPAWYEGDIYFTSNLNSRKIKNIQARPQATMAFRLPGLDVTINGRVAQVSDPVILDAVAQIYRSDGWPAEVAGDALTAPYSAQSAGPAPWHVFCLRFDEVVGLRLSESGGATRWRFADE